MKLSKERLWCLGWWRDGGWTQGRPMIRGIKKWEHHIDMLVKEGLLECDDLGGMGAVPCRITDAGRRALKNQESDRG